MFLIKFERVSWFSTEKEFIFWFIELRKSLLLFSKIFFIFIFSLVNKLSKSSKDTDKTFDLIGKFSLFEVSIFFKITINCSL